MMPRKPRMLQCEYPYHVYNRSNNREPFPIQGVPAWEKCCAVLWETQLLFDAKIHAFVLMNNHYHLLLSTPQANLSEIMWHFSKQMSEFFNKGAGTINHRFGSQFKASMIKDPKHFYPVFKYVYQNPLRAGLCSTVEKYPFSTLHGLLGYSKSHLRMDVCAFGADLFGERLVEIEHWINTQLISKPTPHIRVGLERSQFKLPKAKNNEEKFERSEELECRAF